MALQSIVGWSMLALPNLAEGVYLANQSGAASWQGPWIDTQGVPELSWIFSWSAVAATAGQLGFDVTNDPATAVAGALGANGVTIPGTSIGTWYGVADGTVGIVAGASGIVTRNSWRFIRGVYVRGAGGGAAQFQGFIHGRGV